jgi:hypothetical protein
MKYFINSAQVRGDVSSVLYLPSSETKCGEDVTKMADETWWEKLHTCIRTSQVAPSNQNEDKRGYHTRQRLNCIYISVGEHGGKERLGRPRRRRKYGP